jgi:hypothetical protein
LPLAAAKRNLDAVSLCQIQLRASGGNLANLTSSFAIIDEMVFIAGGEQRDAANDMFRRTYWDTALAASDPVLRMRRDWREPVKFCMQRIFRIYDGTWPYAPSNGSCKALS